jgi:protein-L-isoaspartate(D-aspartate) O-methyltransferase
VRHGDGYRGWPDEAPFDAVIVTAAAPEIPRALLEQLAPEGRLIMPVGPRDGMQWLELVEKDARGALGRRTLLPVRFVPLVEGKR